MKALRRTLLVLATLATLIALFYAVEGLRGMRVWRQIKADLEAKGERFDWKSLAPPAVPNADNFAQTPLLAPLFDLVPVPSPRPGEVTTKPRNQAAFDRVINFKFTGNNPPPFGNWRLSQSIDLAAWQAHFATTTNATPAPASLPPAEAILHALAPFDPEMNELRLAARRPHSQFHIRYDDNFAALLPHLTVLRKFSQLANLQCQAHLALGKSDAALDDLRLAFRFADAIAAEPVLISGLVQIAMLENALQPVWEGLYRRQWSDTQLVALDQQLARTDLLAAYHRAIRGEQAFSINAIDFIRDHPRQYARLFDVSVSELSGGLAFLIPSGWLDQNKAFIVNLHQEFSLPVLDPQKRQFRFEIYDRAKDVEAKLGTSQPYRIFARLLFPSVMNVSEKFAHAQVAIDLARIACALERHRLKHGAFPETTAALVPQFLPQLPLDLMSGNPLIYRPQPDGHFLLYSVGLNKTDDHGRIALTTEKKPRANPKAGDWVWTYSPPSP